MSDDDKKTPRMRRQAISVASSGLSATSTPRFGKKSGKYPYIYSKSRLYQFKTEPGDQNSNCNVFAVSRSFHAVKKVLMAPDLTDI